jgi:acyl-CoA synthetase (AMP-forming)/AMP-acid ligase II
MKSIDVVPTWYWPDGVPRYQSPPRSTVYKTAVERWARRTPDNIALDRNGTQIDYRTLDERVKRASAWMRQAAGGRGSDSRNLRVAVAATQTIEGVVAILGALHAGADTLVVDPATPDTELRSVLAAFGCELLIAENTAGLGGGWNTANLQGISLPVAAGQDKPEVKSTDRSQAGRLGFRWGDAVVLQPNAALLGWSMAFRDFAMLDKGELFTVSKLFSAWEGMIGLLAPLAVGATSILHSGSLAEVLGAASRERLSGIWLDWTQAEALASDLSVGQRRGDLNWVYISVDSPFSVRKRRRLGRMLGSQILTVLGTPATGSVAGSPRTWFIDEAVGTPTTGVDLFPVDSPGGRLSDAPWPLLASASVGVKSTFVVPEMSIEGTAPGRFISKDVFDTGTSGMIDANGFLYLV